MTDQAPPAPSRRGSSYQTPSIPPPRGFLPVTEQSAFSPRGQRLSSIIQSRAADPSIVRRMSSRLVDERAENDSDLEQAWQRDGPPAQTPDGKHLQTIVSGDGRGIEMAIDHEPPVPPSNFPTIRSPSFLNFQDRRFSSSSGDVLDTPMMRSQRLIGNSNPRYKW